MYKNGLNYYSVCTILDSSWIDEIEKQNSIHPKHNKNNFLKNLNHYIFTFQDATLECIVNEGDFWKPEIKIFDDESDAYIMWNKIFQINILFY